MDPKTIVRTAFQVPLVDGGFEDAADRWLSPDYRQSVDGKPLDFAGFRSHMTTLEGPGARTATTIIFTTGQTLNQPHWRHPWPRPL